MVNDLSSLLRRDAQAGNPFLEYLGIEQPLLAPSARAGTSPDPTALAMPPEAMTSPRAAILAAPRAETPATAMPSPTAGSQPGAQGDEPPRTPLTPKQMAEGYWAIRDRISADPEVLKRLTPRLDDLKRQIYRRQADAWQGGDPTQSPAKIAEYWRHMSLPDGWLGDPPSAFEYDKIRSYLDANVEGSKKKSVDNFLSSFNRGDKAGMEKAMRDGQMGILPEGAKILAVMPAKDEYGLPIFQAEVRLPDGSTQTYDNAWAARLLGTAEGHLQARKEAEQEPLRKAKDQAALLEAQDKIKRQQWRLDNPSDFGAEDNLAKLQNENATLEAEDKNRLMKWRRDNPEAAAAAAPMTKDEEFAAEMLQKRIDAIYKDTSLSADQQVQKIKQEEALWAPKLARVFPQFADRMPAIFKKPTPGSQTGTATPEEPVPAPAQGLIETVQSQRQREEAVKTRREADRRGQATKDATWNDAVATAQKAIGTEQGIDAALMKLDQVYEFLNASEKANAERLARVLIAINTSKLPARRDSPSNPATVTGSAPNNLIPYPW